MIGQTLSHYRIVEKLGAGGMGEVYTAEDTKLSRKVALKVLPPEMAENAERRARFEREAKAVAALNHPNIVTVFSVEEAEGVHFITMELVKGKTLSELIPKKGMPLNKFFEIAIPLADAVSAAHEQGIIHRDLKPDNLMVGDDGRLKILDFGLAKLKPGHAESGLSELPTQSATAEGRILGTVAYMSPEQAEGKTIDNRSDIFSMGIILYEMATGGRPFKGDTAASLLASILRDTPQSATETNPSLPRELGKIIRRCLVKDTEHRYQTAKDVRNELEELKQEVDSGDFVSADQVVTSATQRDKRNWFFVAAAILAVGIGAASWFFFLPTEPAGQPAHPVPLTSFEGMEQDPALSPDGDQVAFVWNGGSDGHYHLYVKLIGGGEPLQLTKAPADDFSPAWSPDGLEVAFLREAQGGNEVLSVPALGGPERRLANSTVSTMGVLGRASTHGLDWSPDGRFLAMVDNDSPEERGGIFLLSRETGEKQRLTSPQPPYVIDSHPAFSPDGRRIAFIRRWPTAPANIFVQPLEGGAALRLLTSDDTTDEWSVWDLDWSSDGSALVFTSGFGLTLSGLWTVSVTGGDPSPLSFGDNAKQVSVADAGERLAYSLRLVDPNIWRVGGPISAERGPAAKVIHSTLVDVDPNYSPDGGKVAFSSDRSGERAIWVCDSDGENCYQLTYGDWAESPTWSPSGQSIAFHQRRVSRGKTTFDIFVMDAKGGFSRAVTQDEFVNAVPRWSADGRWIYFWSDRASERQIFKISTEDGRLVQLTRKGGWEAFEDDGGRFVYYAKDDPLEGIWRIPVDGGEETPVITKPVNAFRWCLWKQNIVYVNQEGKKGPTIELFNLTTGEMKELVSLGSHTELASGFTVSPDGRWILYPKVDVKSDIMLVKNFR